MENQVIKSIFVNPQLKCYKSIIEQPEKFQEIIELVNQHPQLFPPRRASYTWKIYERPDDYVRYDGHEEDAKYLDEFFFKGIYTQDSKDKNVYHQTRRSIFEILYDKFLNLANIMNNNVIRKEIYVGGFHHLIAETWNYSIEKIYLIIRSILNLNKDTINSDDVSIWKLNLFKNKSVNSEILNKIKHQFNVLDSLFKFDEVLKVFISKQFAHITEGDFANFRKENSDYLTINTVFNLFECVYSLMKIAYYYICEHTQVPHMVMDSEHYAGDLFQHEIIKKASDLYYDFQMNDTNRWFLNAILMDYCRRNNIPSDSTQWSHEQLISILEFLVKKVNDNKHEKSIKYEFGDLISKLKLK